MSRPYDIDKSDLDADLDVFGQSDGGQIAAAASGPAPHSLFAAAAGQLPGAGTATGFFDTLAAALSGGHGHAAAPAQDGAGSSATTPTSSTISASPILGGGSGAHDGAAISDGAVASTTTTTSTTSTGTAPAPAHPSTTTTVIGGSTPQQPIKQLWSSSDVPTGSLFSQQWNLHNTGQNGGTSGVDIDILPVWHLGYTGKGVSIGVFDTAMDATNPGLAPNLDLSKEITSNMVADNTFVNPTVITSSAVDSHATAVGGIIAAAAGNSTGVTGIAYNATLTPVDILGAQSGMYDWEAEAYEKNFAVDNNSWGFTTPFSVGELDASSQYWVISGLANAAIQGRGGLGSIVTLAAGNYRQTGMTTELTGPTVDRHAIEVGATDSTGHVAYYSNGGASLLVVAPSSGLTSGITTTDISGSMGYSSGDTTSTFGGTSAATPEIDGVAACMLQAAPNLGWRDVQDILAITARHTGSAIGAADTGYETGSWGFNGAHDVNGGGMHFSTDYGFGLVDAAAAVRLGQSWDLVHAAPGDSATEMSASASYSGPSMDVGGAHTENLSFSITSHESVESMVLDLTNLTINHANDLTVTLTSPDGTTSTLLADNGGSSATIGAGWELMSRQFMGEDAYGTWHLTIADNNAADTGSLSNVTLTAYGSGIANNAIEYYTDEFATYAAADHSRILVPTTDTAIDAAAVTGATNVNLMTKVASIDGVAISLGANNGINTVVAGGGDSVLVGNNLNDTLVGGQGNDIISTGNGANYVDAGTGNNIVNFGTGANQLALHEKGMDTVIDFVNGVDKLLMSKSEFTQLAGGLNANDFVTAANNTTHTASGGLVFDTANSTLYFDADGHSALTAIATMVNHAKIAATDVVLTA